LYQSIGLLAHLNFVVNHESSNPSGKASSKRLDDDAVPIVEQVDFTAEMNHRQKFVQWRELKEMLQVIG
jgi:hypothetical protein